MVWGCMSSRGVGEIHFIDGIMNADVYCNILKEKFIPSLKHLGRGAIFQQVNDSKHSAKVTSVFLKKRKVKVLQWPSMSPDLNSIEHQWNEFKRQVEQRRPSNIMELKEIVLTEWENIPENTCSNLVYSMPRCVAAVIANGGSHTKY